MAITVEIVSGVLHWPDQVDRGSGAAVRFTGAVRGEEDGRTIAGLEYEAYLPMAENQMRRIFGEIRDMHTFDDAVALHRVGFVPVGEAAILVEVRSKHRGVAFEAVRIFMDRLKQDVPIWKTGAKWK